MEHSLKIYVYRLTSTFTGSFSGSACLGSGSGAFSSVSSIWLMLPVAGRERVPPRDSEDRGRDLETKSQGLIA